MANVIIKSDERRAFENKVMRDFGGGGTAQSREYAECIAARSAEAIKEASRNERS